jgi:hypothetical protein
MGEKPLPEAERSGLGGETCCRHRPLQGQHGPTSRVTEAGRTHLRTQVDAQPDLTLAELRELTNIADTFLL